MGDAAPWIVTVGLTFATVGVSAWAVAVNRRASEHSPSKELVDAAMSLVRELRREKETAEQERDDCHEREQKAGNHEPNTH